MLRLRFGDFTRATRSHTVGAPTDRTTVLLAVARALLAAAQPLIDERGSSLIGICPPHLGRTDHIQPELPIDWEEGTRLDAVLAPCGTSSAPPPSLAPPSSAATPAGRPRSSPKHE